MAVPQRAQLLLRTFLPSAAGLRRLGRARAGALLRLESFLQDILSSTEAHHALSAYLSGGVMIGTDTGFLSDALNPFEQHTFGVSQTFPVNQLTGRCW